MLASIFICTSLIKMRFHDMLKGLLEETPPDSAGSIGEVEPEKKKKRFPREPS